MIQVKYFSELFYDIECKMNEWLRENKEINVLKLHINSEYNSEGYQCVNGYIMFEI